MATRVPAGSRLRVSGLAASFAFIVFVGVASVCLTTSATAAGLDKAVIFAAGAPAALAILFLLLGLLRLLGSGRDGAVARQITDSRAVVFGSGRTAGLKNAVGPYRVGPPETAVPYDFTVVCSSDAVNLWTGSIALPVKFAEIPWRDVVQTTVGTVAIDERRSRGIAIQTTAAGRIELQPLGHGFVAAFPLSKTTLGELAAEMNAHARACKERQ